jgi:hypothetical protein
MKCRSKKIRKSFLVMICFLASSKQVLAGQSSTLTQMTIEKCVAQRCINLIAQSGTVGQWTATIALKNPILHLKMGDKKNSDLFVQSDLGFLDLELNRVIFLNPKIESAGLSKAKEFVVNLETLSTKQWNHTL